MPRAFIQMAFLALSLFQAKKIGGNGDDTDLRDGRRGRSAHLMGRLHRSGVSRAPAAACDRRERCRANFGRWNVARQSPWDRGLGSIGVRQGEVNNTLKYEEGRKGGFDPHTRIVDMDADGIDAAFLYLGLFTGAVEDPDLSAAMCRAYNRWLVDYCKPYPDRLFGVAMLPMQSVENAMAEMKFARETLGMCGGFLRQSLSRQEDAKRSDVCVVLEPGGGA